MARVAAIASLLLLTSWCRAGPPCEPPFGLKLADIDQYCLIHQYRTDCLDRLGYDMSRKDWLVEVYDFKGCVRSGRANTYRAPSESCLRR